MSDIKKKYNQLQLSLEDAINDYPLFPSYDFESLKKIYIPQEIFTHSFFLNLKSKRVQESRVGHKAYIKYLELTKKGLSEAEIKKQTSYITSPATNIRSVEAEEKNEITTVIDTWTIFAHQNYGLPDEFDGHVWDVIQYLISMEYCKSGKFYALYPINENIIMKELIRRGVLNSRGGSSYNRIVNSLDRLAKTKYQNKKGITRIDTNEVVNIEEYDFSLLSSIYRKGEKLEDGTLTQVTLLALDPLMRLNLQNNHYNILSNIQRDGIKSYISKMMYDSFHMSVYAQFSSGYKDLFIAIKSNTNPYMKIGYEKFCTKVGLDPHYKKKLYASKIKEQLDEYVAELKKQNVIIDYQIEKCTSGLASFNLIFCFHNLFIENVLSVISRSVKELNFDKISENMISSYFAKLEDQVKSIQIKNKIKNRETA